MENNAICKCGHIKEHHAHDSERVQNSPCYECLGLYMHDRTLNVVIENAHRICADFSLDNLRYLEMKANEIPE